MALEATGGDRMHGQKNAMRVAAKFPRSHSVIRRASGSSRLPCSFTWVVSLPLSLCDVSCSTFTLAIVALCLASFCPLQMTRFDNDTAMFYAAQITAIFECAEKRAWGSQHSVLHGERASVVALMTCGQTAAGWCACTWSAARA